MKNANGFIKKSNILAIDLAHFTLSIAIFAVAWFMFRYHGRPIIRVLGFRYNYFVILAYAVLLLFFSRTYNAYMLGYSRVRTLVFSQTLSQLFSLAGIYLMVSVAWNRFDNPGRLLLSLIAQLILNIIWSTLANAAYFKVYPPRKAIFIYRNQQDKKRFGVIQREKTRKMYKVVKEMAYDGEFADIEHMLHDYEAIFVAGVNSRCRNGILKYCKETNTPGLFLPHVGDVIMQEAKHIQAFDSPVLYVDRKVLRLEYAIAKRTFDILMSIIGLIVLSPILLITALAIKLYDGGPVLYRQIRLTKDEKEFSICKFRSMRVDAEKDGVARLSTGNADDRVTPVGKWVRKLRIDELPQLWNILKGDMSIVGPRPERPEIAEQYYKEMSDFRLRTQVRAGLTGYAQIYGRYNTDPYQKLEFDLLYINNMNFFTDLQLMFATFSVLFSSESTEGIEEGSTTALSEQED